MKFEVPGAVLDVSLDGDDGPAVVALHGLASSRRRDHDVGLDTTRDLSGVRLLRYDARGHGLSTGRPVADDFRWTTMATDLLSLLDEYFPGEQVYAAGTSMGLGAVLHAVVREPDHFCGLTLQLTPTAWKTRVGQRKFYTGAARFIEDKDFDTFCAPGRDAKPCSAQAEWPYAPPDMDPDLAPSIYRGAADSDLPDKDQVARIRQPVQILSWTGDATHPVSTAKELAALMPQADLHLASTPADFARWPALVAEALAPFQEGEE